MIFVFVHETVQCATAAPAPECRAENQASNLRARQRLLEA